MSQTLQAVRGMNDILPDEAEFWELFEDTIRSWLKGYGYRPIRMPIVEPTPLFKRAIGEVTDIVEKEMYSFIDSLNGEPLTLRPEGTAGCVRAVIQHNLIARQPQRLYYFGQMFRHERPQKGRYRQFHQVGVEALGYAGPDIDAEMILMGARLWGDLGLDGIELQINSLGQPEERAQHRAALITYFEENAELLDEEAKRRLHANPLRILDTKNPAMQDIVAQAPQLLGFLGEASLAHFETVQALLTASGVPWSVNPRAVRGLDYYSHTVFEFITDELGAQGTLCGGGRYDGLFEILGGKPTPGVGWGMGIERVLELLRVRGLAASAVAPDAFVVIPDAGVLPIAFQAMQALREAGVRVQMHAGAQAAPTSMKSQFKRADSSGARFALVFGASEVAQGQLTVKNLRDGSGAQQLRALADVREWASTLQLPTS